MPDQTAAYLCRCLPDRRLSGPDTSNGPVTAGASPFCRMYGVYTCQTSLHRGCSAREGRFPDQHFMGPRCVLTSHSSATVQHVRGTRTTCEVQTYQEVARKASCGAGGQTRRRLPHASGQRWQKGYSRGSNQGLHRHPDATRAKRAPPLRHQLGQQLPAPAAAPLSSASPAA